MVDMLHTMPHMGGHLPMLFPMLLPLLLLGAALFILLRTGRLGPVRFAPGARSGPAPHRPTAEDEALSRLAERLAEGDITPEEYLERSSVLRGSGPAAGPDGRV